MLRAIVLAARLDFTVDGPIVDAIRRLRAGDRAQRPGAPDRGDLQDPAVGLGRARVPRARRRRAAASTWRPSCCRIDDEGLWEFLGGLDAYRQRFEATPETLTNAGAARHAARAARLHRAEAVPPGAQRPRARGGDGGRPPAARARGVARPQGDARRAAGGAARRRAAAADPRAAAAAAGHGVEPRARKRALLHARPVRGGADVARDPRPRAGDCRALAGVHRGRRCCRAESWTRRGRRGGAGDAAAETAGRSDALGTEAARESARG